MSQHNDSSREPATYLNYRYNINSTGMSPTQAEKISKYIKIAIEGSVYTCEIIYKAHRRAKLLQTVTEFPIYSSITKLIGDTQDIDNCIFAYHTLVHFKDHDPYVVTKKLTAYVVYIDDKYKIWNTYVTRANLAHSNK